jgi:regulator of sigma E protease
MTLLAIDWLSVGVKAGQFILSFSILVTLHELGHFIPAKLFNCRVDKFYLFLILGLVFGKRKKGKQNMVLAGCLLGAMLKLPA